VAFCSRTIAFVLLCISSAAMGAGSWHFTVTADPRGQHELFGDTLEAVNTLAGGPGAFHVTAGDIDETIPDNRAVIDAKFGASAVWYPVIGNHEAETAADMTWLRDEYANGNGLRTPLKNFTDQNGPAGCVQTTYSWDYGNAHFVVLNQYWDSGTAAGSDVALDGDVIPALRTWLADDLAAHTQPYTFVFGHEPAFPSNRHVGDSLDAYPANRDAFWALLEQYDVDAYICGHTHVYSRHQGDANDVGNVWQIDAGAAGNGDNETFLDVVMSDTEVRFDVYDDATGAWTLKESWSEPIPEPTCLTLLGVGVLAILRRRIG
jgi:hypothetical protein